MNESEPNQLVSDAADNIRAFTHQTRTAQLPDGCMAAPDVYRILGSAAELAYSLPQALTQLTEALRRSLTVFDIYDRDRQPADSIAIASHALSAAADAFTQAAQHLSDAPLHTKASTKQHRQPTPAAHTARRPRIVPAGPRAFESSGHGCRMALRPLPAAGARC